MKAWIFVIVFGFTMGQAIAQEGIGTDRPGQSNGPSVIPKGYLQLENGTGISSGTLYDALLIRVGVGEIWEVRLNPVGGITLPLGDSLRYQVANALGVKVALWQSDRWALSILPSVNLQYPANTWVTPASATWQGQVLASVAVTDRLGITSNVGVSGGAEAPLTMAYTFNVSGSLVENLTGFIEVYGTHRDVPAWDAGLIYPITQNFQVDLSGGYGFVAGQQAGFLELGVSYRNPVFRKKQE